MAAIAPGKSRTLHNFSLPSRLSWGSRKLLRCSNDAVSLLSQNPQNASFHSPPPSPPPQQQQPPSSSTHVEDSNHNNSHPIGVIREKLIDDFRSEVEQFRATFLGNSDFTPQPPPPSQPRPWNLRIRRSPATAGIAPSTTGNASYSGNKRAKFSVPLSRKEIEDDFVRMTGKRPPRKPKKHRSRVQKELDDMFPGSYLEEVTADMY